MKKNIKKISSVLFSAVALVFASCNNIALNENETNTVLTKGKASLSISAETDVRSIYPELTTDYFTSWKLTGKLNDGESQALGEWTSYTAMTSNSFGIDAGAWEFTLTAEKAGTKYSDTKSKTITAGSTNSVAFNLKAQEFGVEEGKGTINIDFRFEKEGLIAIESKIYNLATPAATPGVFNTTEISPTFEDEKYHISYNTQLYSGMYRIDFNFNNGTNNKLYTYSACVRILKDITTSAVIDVPETTAWNITTDFDGAVSLGDASLEYMPLCYSSSSEDIILPNAYKPGRIFDGWYEGENKITTIKSSDARDYSIKAKFKVPMVRNIAFSCPMTNSVLITWEDETGITKDSSTSYTYDVYIDDNLIIEDIPQGTQKAFVNLGDLNEHSLAISIVPQDDPSKYNKVVSGSKVQAKTVVAYIEAAYGYSMPLVPNVVKKANISSTLSTDNALISTDNTEKLSKILYDRYFVMPAINGTNNENAVSFMATNADYIVSNLYVHSTEGKAGTYNHPSNAIFHWGNDFSQSDYLLLDALGSELLPDTAEGRAYASFEISDLTACTATTEAGHSRFNKTAGWSKIKSLKNNRYWQHYGCILRTTGSNPDGFSGDDLLSASYSFKFEYPEAINNATFAAVTPGENTTTANSATLNWTDSTTPLDMIKYYSITTEQKGNGDTDIAPVIVKTNTSAGSATISNLKPKTEYTFTVKSVTLNGNDKTVTTTATTLEQTAIPTNVNAEAKYTGSVLVTWTDVNADAVSGLTYKVEVFAGDSVVADETLSKTGIAAGKQQAHIIGLTPNTSYKFKVSSVGSEFPSTDDSCVNTVTAKTVKQRIHNHCDANTDYLLMNNYGSVVSADDSVISKIDDIPNAAGCLTKEYNWLIYPSLYTPDDVDTISIMSSINEGMYLCAYSKDNSRKPNGGSELKLGQAFDWSFGSEGFVNTTNLLFLMNSSNNDTLNKDASFKLEKQANGRYKLLSIGYKETGTDGMYLIAQYYHIFFGTDSHAKLKAGENEWTFTDIN